MISHTVTQLTRYIKELFDESTTLQDVLVQGEVSNFRQASSGHCYFTLKDASAEIRCVMWRGLAARLRALPDQGTLIEVRGYVSVYERGGSYQLYVNRLSSIGAGDIWQRYLELKEKLEQEGLFAPEHKQPLPEWPTRIGVVTSPTGAALRDILNVVSTRYPLVELVISPTLVQGVDAPSSIVRALQRLQALVGIDVIIVARGGGSLEDLWAFSDEGVARAIYDCPIPVVTGVGHETDFTLADFCADKRTPTPSAAAAAVVPDRQELIERLNSMAFALDEAMQGCIERRWEILDRAELLLERHNPKARLLEYRQRLDESLDRLRRAMHNKLQFERSLLTRQRMRIEALDPERVLQRGYAFVYDWHTGAGVTRQSMTKNGQELSVQFIDGSIKTRVVSVGTGKGDREGSKDDRE